MYINTAFTETFIYSVIFLKRYILCNGDIFCTRPDRPWDPPSLLYNGYRVSFPGVKRRGRSFNHPPPPRAEVKERAQLYIYYPPSLHALFQGEIYFYLILCNAMQRHLELIQCPCEDNRFRSKHAEVQKGTCRLTCKHLYYYYYYYYYCCCCCCHH